MDIRLESRTVELALQRALRAVQHPAQILKPVGIEAVQQVQENFIQQGRPRKWKPLSDATLFKVAGKTGIGKRGLNAKGAKRIGAKRILTATGTLMRSIHFKLQGNSVLVGTNIAYGRIHHFGGKAGRGKKVTIPARPWLVLPDEGKAALIRAATAAMRAAINP